MMPKGDEILATFQPQPDTETVLEAMGACGLAPSKPLSAERGFAVYRVPTGGNLETARKILDKSAIVANAVPVLVDDEGLVRYLLADELTVQFKVGTTKEEAERIINQEGCTILVRQRTEGYYTLVVAPGRGVFELIREFSAIAQVAFCRAE